MTSSSIFGARLDEHAGDTDVGRRALRMAQARHAGFVELQQENLRPRGRFLADRKDFLYQPVRHVVMGPAGTERAGSAVYFFADETGQLVFLNPAHPHHTVAELEAAEDEKQRSREEKRTAQREARDEAIRSLERHPVTLADLHGRELPTLRAAAETLERWGSVTAHAGGLVVEIPASTSDASGRASANTRSTAPASSSPPRRLCLTPSDRSRDGRSRRCCRTRACSPMGASTFDALSRSCGLPAPSAAAQAGPQTRMVKPLFKNQARASPAPEESLPWVCRIDNAFS